MPEENNQPGDQDPSVNSEDPNDNQEPEQLALTRRLVELSLERTQMSGRRVELSEQRSRMSAERSKMSEDRSRMSSERTRMSAERSELSAERSYLNVERTLSVWVRTALSLMVFGIAVDRFGLFLYQMPGGSPEDRAWSDALSNWAGISLIALGVVVVLTSGVRFLLYSADFKHTHTVPRWHGPFLAPFFALLVAIFGVAVLAILVAIAH